MFDLAEERDRRVVLVGDPTVVEDYDERGRLHGGTAMRVRGAAVNAWWEAIERGETASLMVPTNAAVVELNSRLAHAEWRAPRPS